MPREDAARGLDDATPRVLIGCFGLDQHEAGALLAAAVLRDAGAEVIYLGRFNLPTQLAEIAAQEDADVVGISCHSWEYLTYTAELLALLGQHEAPAALVLGGSVITPADEQRLVAMGVAGVLGPGAPKEQIVDSVWAATAARRRASDSS